MLLSSAGRPRWREWRRRRSAPSAASPQVAASRRRQCGRAARWTRRRRSSPCARPSTCSAAGLPPSPSGATRRPSSTSAQRSVNRSPPPRPAPGSTFFACGFIFVYYAAARHGSGLSLFQSAAQEGGGGMLAIALLSQPIPFFKETSHLLINLV